MCLSQIPSTNLEKYQMFIDIMDLKSDNQFKSSYLNKYYEENEIVVEHFSTKK